jgi:CRISPR-associated protein Cas5h
MPDTESDTDATGDGQTPSTSAGTDSRATFIPDSCVGFDITADFAHFRKVGNNSAKPSYRIPPRTTLAGLLAGILGLPRDSYYDLFAPANSALAVVPKSLPHTYTMGITTVNTKANEAIQYLPEDRHWSKGAEMLTPASYVELDRQRDTYEMLVDPVYRVYVALEDTDTHEELQDRLLSSRYHYSPSLGLSECLAEISAVQTHAVEGSTADRIESVAYDDDPLVPEPGETVARERAPLYMEATADGRRTTEFGNITYVPDRDTLRVDHPETCAVDDRQVLFY